MAIKDKANFSFGSRLNHSMELLLFLLEVFHKGMGDLCVRLAE